MAKKKATSDDKEHEKPRVNPELEGFDIQVNSFGEIITNYDINKINDFLNLKVDDKKLRGRKDLRAFEGKDKLNKNKATDEEAHDDEEVTDDSEE